MELEPETIANSTTANHSLAGVASYLWMTSAESCSLSLLFLCTNLHKALPGRGTVLKGWEREYAGVASGRTVQGGLMPGPLAAGFI